MKKFGVIIVALVLVLCIGTVSAFAARGSGACYVDANGDGICDNYGTRGNGACYVDANGDGICDNYGTRGNGAGRHCGHHR